ncbi:MAG: OmpA family protein [Bacteroidales bacterium]|nr:OmpA family protein [Bacteroidales bacterium]
MKITIFILLCLSATSLSAQKSQADKKFKLYEYSEAIPLYVQYLEKSPDDYDATKNLALSYKLINNIDGSIAVYRSLVAMKESIPEDLYNFIQLLRISGNLHEARQNAMLYLEKSGSENAKAIIKSLDMYDEFMSGKDMYDVINKTVNHSKSVFSNIPYQNGMLVTAESVGKGRSSWTGKGITKLYSTDVHFGQLMPFAKEVMTDFNDGPATLSGDGSILYFTTSNKKTLQEQDVNTRKLQISSAILRNGKWNQADLFQFNNYQYNLAHPALSNDGNLLVFASDKPGGKGGMDLYYCTKLSDNSWSEPINISVVNTSENELFPTFDNSGNLYFASSGLPGLGGLDVYVSKIERNNFSVPTNLKAPINSSYDDFSLTTTDQLETGYVSTNRFGSPEKEDIAYFSKKVIVEPKPSLNPIVKITVVDKYTSIPLPYVSVSLKDEMSNIVYQGMTDPDGIIQVEELAADNYRVQGILNDVTTTIATIKKEDFVNPLIERTITHNDPRFTLSGIVTNSRNNQPVGGVTVSCENKDMHKSSTRITGLDGKFFFQLEQSSDFKVFGEQKGWLSSETVDATTKGLDRSKDLYVVLRLSMQQPSADEVIRLDKIYYDYDKCDIKHRAAVELNRLVKLMNDFPDMIIELSSHTDSRGSDEYNLKLSQCRADAAVDYILEKGISKTRIIPRGYGETKLVNECSNGVICSEAKHQANRRTEFTIESCPSCPKIEK